MESVELTMVDSVCQLGKSVGHQQLWSAVGLFAGVRLTESSECSIQWKCIRSWKHSKVEVETESEIGQNKAKVKPVKQK